MKNFTLLLAAFLIFSIGFAGNLPGHTSDWEYSFTEDEKNRDDLKVYPNPCKTQKITVEFQSNEISEISIINIAGKEVLYKKLQFPDKKEILQIGNIPNGIYLLRVKSVDNKELVRKLIISSN